MSRLARVVFVALVAATFGAFFMAQALKSAPSVARVKGVARYFSPNGDGTRDVNDFSVILRERDRITVSIVDADGDEVRRLGSGIPVRAYQHAHFAWDGRTDTGERAPDGRYRVEVALGRQNRSVLYPKAIRLDTTPPRPRVDVADASSLVVGPTGRPIRLRIAGAPPRSVRELRVWRTDLEPARQVASFTAPPRANEAQWDGRAQGRPAPPGVYLVELRAEDRSGNRGSSAPGLPQRPARVRGRAGITVRTIAAAPPLRPVLAGSRVVFGVDARGLPYRWQVRRLGASRPAARGRAKARQFRLSVPAPRGPSGIYLLELRNGRRATAVPFLVQSPDRAPFLVVVPAITWIGSDRVDDDRDGLPDTLDAGVPVRHANRVLRGLPAGFAEDIAPLLVYLDRFRIRYDLTSDLALADSRDPRATDRKGVLLAGPLRWVPRGLARRLRTYVAGGGTVVSLGADSLRRGVQVGRVRLARPTQPVPDDPFGARLAPLRRLARPVPLVPLAGSQADHPLLTAWSGVLHGFTVLEESEAREDGPARVLAGIGQGVSEREIAEAEAENRLPREARPALTASKLGKGLVIRVGLPQWVRRLADPQVQQLTRNMVDLLRGVTPKPRSPLR